MDEDKFENECENEDWDGDENDIGNPVNQASRSMPSLSCLSNNESG